MEGDGKILVNIYESDPFRMQVEVLDKSESGYRYGYWLTPEEMERITLLTKFADELDTMLREIKLTREEHDPFS